MGLAIVPFCVSDDADLSSSPSAITGLGPENLQISDRGLVWRVAGDNASLTVNLNGRKRVGGIILWRHSWTVSSTWRIRLYDEPSLAGNLVFDSGTVDAVPAKLLGELNWGVDTLGTGVEGVDYSYQLFTQDYVCESILIDIDDPYESMIEAGRLFLGPLIQPTYGFDWGLSLSWESETRRIRTAAGGLRVESYATYRRLQLNLSRITEVERSSFFNMLRVTGNRQELWISARTGDGGGLEAYNAILGYLEENSPIVRNRRLKYSTSLAVEES